MSHDQAKRAGSAPPLPANENSPLNELPGIVGSIAAQGFDSLGAGAPRTRGQYQYGGALPIVAPAARVSPAVGEVRL